MKTLLPPTVLLLLSSCTLPCVDIGGAIKYSTEHYREVDIRQASEGQTYQCKNGDYYAKLPIVSYTRSWPVVYPYPAFEIGNRESRRQATGQYQWVHLRSKPDPQKPLRKKFETTILREEPELANTKQIASPPIPDYPWTVLLSGTPQEEPSCFRKLAAAPFDHALDPALTLVVDIVFVPTAIVTSTLLSPFIYFFSKEPESIQASKDTPPPIK